MKHARLYNSLLNTPWLLTIDMLNTGLAIVQSDSGGDRERAEELRERRAHRPAALAMRTGEALAGSSGITVREGIAHMAVIGPLVRYADIYADVSGLASVESLAADLQMALAAPAIKGIVMEFDSPGGEVTGIASLASAIYAARAIKPIWAYADGMAASAGYWLASAASQFIVDPSALVGSIGVVMATRDPAGVKDPPIRFVSSQSPLKNPDPTDDAGRAAYQRIVDDTATVFIEAIALYRGVSTATVLSSFGQGDLFVGQRAVARGMADSVGTFESTLRGIIRATTEEQEMTGSKKFWSGLFQAARDEGLTDEAAPTPEALTAAQPPQRSAADLAELAALRAQLEANAREIREGRAAAQGAAASAFAHAQVAAGRVAPAEHAALVTLHSAAAAQSPELLASFEAFLIARPAILTAMTVEAIPAAAAALGLDRNPAAANDADEQAAISAAALRFLRKNSKTGAN